MAARAASPPLSAPTEGAAASRTSGRTPAGSRSPGRASASAKPSTQQGESEKGGQRSSAAGSARPSGSGPAASPVGHPPSGSARPASGSGAAASGGGSGGVASGSLTKQHSGRSDDWAAAEVSPGDGVGLLPIQLLGFGSLLYSIGVLAASGDSAHRTELDWGVPPKLGLVPRDGSYRPGMFAGGVLGLVGGAMLTVAPVLPQRAYFVAACALCMAQAVVITVVTGVWLEAAGSGSSCTPVLRCNYGCGHLSVAGSAWLAFQLMVGVGLLRGCCDYGAGRGRRRGVGVASGGLCLLFLILFVVTLTDLEFATGSCLRGLFYYNGEVHPDATRCEIEVCNAGPGRSATMEALWAGWADSATAPLRARASGCGIGVVSSGLLSWTLGCRRDLCRRGWRRQVKVASSTHNWAAALLMIGTIIFIAAQGKLLDLQEPAAAEAASGAGELVRVGLTALACAVTACAGSFIPEEERQQEMHKTLDERLAGATGLVISDLIKGDGVLWFNLPGLMRPEVAKKVAPLLPQLIEKARCPTAAEQGVIIVFGISIGSCKMEREVVQTYLSALPDQGVAAISMVACGLTADCAKDIARYVRRAKGLREITLERNVSLRLDAAAWAAIEVAARAQGVRLLPTERRPFASAASDAALVYDKI
eukprot:TRINITY_DN70846_c0_g1_i1.p1 TRINITY_DN70846_c0_g1~~TRINITY_DN70846_c0_g1_i1.p1  ORF type:complete len:675 (+),score=162.83 TRINITY_DN70846_c0_g1_i1:80-2026(+)